MVEVPETQEQFSGRLPGARRCDMLAASVTHGTP